MHAIRPWSENGAFYKGNLHCHSTLSDGRLALDDVIASYRHHGYDFVAVTEHFSEMFGYPIADTRSYRDDRFTTLIGAEIDAPADVVGGHLYLNALGLPLDFAPREPGETIAQIAGRARAGGAFVALACPTWTGAEIADVMAIDAIQAIETWNETAESANARGDAWYLIDEATARGRLLYGLAVDDAHFRPGCPDWFAAWVMVRAKSLTPEALLDALKLGHYYSSQGPAIHDVRLANGALEITCSPARAIIVAGTPPIGLHSHGSSLTGATFPTPRLAGSYCRITVIDHAGRRAWSNPFFVPVDA